MGRRGELAAINKLTLQDLGSNGQNENVQNVLEFGSFLIIVKTSLVFY